jgi:hypothetical protein
MRERVFRPEDEDGDAARLELDPENAQRGPERGVGKGRIHDRRLEARPSPDAGGLGAEQAGALPRGRLEELTCELAELGPVLIVAGGQVLDGDEGGGPALVVADARPEAGIGVGRPALGVADRDRSVGKGLVQPVRDVVAVTAPAARRREGDERGEGETVDVTSGSDDL